MNYQKTLKTIVKEIRFAIKDSGLKQSDIKIDGLSSARLSHKLNHPEDFRLGELIALCSLFKIDITKVFS